MAEVDQFLWDILDHPDDDALRLVFADWLAAHGEAAHAEFVRLQCTLAAYPHEDEQWLEWQIRQEELWPVIRDRWQAVIEELDLRWDTGPLRLADMRRGFVDRPINLRLAEPALLDRGAGRWTFVLGLRIETFCHANAAFFASPQLRRVDWLNCQRSGVTDAALQPLAASPCYGRLKSLDLFRNDVGPAGVAAVARCPSLTGLTELRLDENKLGDDGVATLVASPVCRTLMTLELFENGIGDAGLIALAQSPYLGALRKLRLDGNHFGAAGIAALAASPHLLNLQELSVDGHGWSPGCIAACRRLESRLGERFIAWSEYYNYEWDEVGGDATLDNGGRDQLGVR